MLCRGVIKKIFLFKKIPFSLLHNLSIKAWLNKCIEYYGPAFNIQVKTVYKQKEAVIFYVSSQ